MTAGGTLDAEEAGRSSAPLHRDGVRHGRSAKADIVPFQRRIHSLGGGAAGDFDYVDMQDDLEAIFGRKVDVVSRRAVEKSPNRFRRRSILDSARIVYAAA